MSWRWLTLSARARKTMVCRLRPVIISIVSRSRWTSRTLLVPLLLRSLARPIGGRMNSAMVRLARKCISKRRERVAVGDRSRLASPRRAPLAVALLLRLLLAKQLLLRNLLRSRVKRNERGRETDEHEVCVEMTLDSPVPYLQSTQTLVLKGLTIRWLPLNNPRAFSAVFLLITRHPAIEVFLAGVYVCGSVLVCLCVVCGWHAGVVGGG